jgi:hypothetical protein
MVMVLDAAVNHHKYISVHEKDLNLAKLGTMGGTSSTNGRPSNYLDNVGETSPLCCSYL